MVTTEQGTISQPTATPSEREKIPVETLPGKIVILSDLHFGDPGATFQAWPAVESFKSELEGIGGVKSIVLLGDFWDMWQYEPVKDMEQSRNFLKRIAELPGLERIVIIPGNHDHNIYRWHMERNFCSAIAPGKKLPPFKLVLAQPCDLLKNLATSQSQPRCDIRYPYMLLEAEIDGVPKRIMLDHGHLLDFFTLAALFSVNVLSTLVLLWKKKVTIRDVEKNNQVFFEALAGSAESDRMSAKVRAIWAVLRFLFMLGGLRGRKGASKLRLRPITRTKGPLKSYMEAVMLTGLFDRTPDYMIYGHTHKCGWILVKATRYMQDLLQSKDTISFTAINIGAWFSQRWAPSPNTYAVIDGAVILRQIGKPDPIYPPLKGITEKGETWPPRSLKTYGKRILKAGASKLQRP